MLKNNSRIWNSSMVIESSIRGDEYGGEREKIPDIFFSCPIKKF